MALDALHTESATVFEKWGIESDGLVLYNRILAAWRLIPEKITVPFYDEAGQENLRRHPINGRTQV